MNKLAKVLIGIGVVGAVAATTYFITKSSEKKTVVIKGVDEEGKTTVEEIVEEESLLDRMEKAAIKKAGKIIIFVAEHQQQIEAVGTMMSLAYTAFSFINIFKELTQRNKMQEQIDEIVKHNNEFRDIWNAYMMLDNDNDHYLNDKLNDIHLDMSMLHEIHENLIPKAV